MRDPKERLRDILDAIAAIERYRDREKADFEADELLQSWSVRHLETLSGGPPARTRNGVNGTQESGLTLES